MKMAQYSEALHDSTLVSISCLTYNHAKYIEKCLDGFIMQKTSFVFEVIVHDDASTDNTASIIREYEQKFPDIIKPIYQIKNQYSRGVTIGKNFIYPRARGKYIALCEGDDYWIDPYKLQKQVDFLEANPDYVLSNSDVDVFYSDTRKVTLAENKRIKAKNRTGTVTGMDIITNDYYVRTLTTLFRKDVLFEYLNSEASEKYYNKLMMGDRPLWIFLAHKGKFHYLPESTGIYCIHENSATHQNNLKKSLRFKLSLREMKMVFLELYPKDFSDSFIKKIRKSYYKCLLRYICFDPEYNAFIDIESIEYKRINKVRKNRALLSLLQFLYKSKFFFERMFQK